MGLKNGIKRLVFNVSAGLADLLYRRPYSDPEAGLRKKLDDEILHLDLVITECCSLKCRDCSNLMQYYQCPEQLSSEDVIRDLSRLFEAFRVRELKILGGEPFVNQKVLIEVLDYLSGEPGDKVDVINIITNGTIVPREECLDAIKANPKTVVTFSNYGKASSSQDEFITVCKEKGIRHTVIDGSFYWLDFGRPVEYSESEEFVKRQYKHCYNRKNCNTLFRGGFYSCPRQAHGIRLGLIPDDGNGYVDLNDPRLKSPDDLKKAVLGVVRRKEPIGACRYCLNGKYIHVPRGVQKD